MKGSVDIACYGPSALERARQDPPDLVALAVALPGLNAIEVCRRLRTFTDAYVLMLSARDGGRQDRRPVCRRRRLRRRAVLAT